jgi:hypothetical protein
VGATVIVLSDKDNVGVAVHITARDAIPQGHKMALRPIAAGDKILKFGVPVGSATTLIEAGGHVHMHNVKSDYLNNRVDTFE